MKWQQRQCVSGSTNVLIQRTETSAVFILTFVFFVFSFSTTQGQELSRSQKGKLRQIKNSVNSAEEKFVSGDFSGAANSIDAVMKRIADLASELNTGQLEDLKVQYNRVVTAHGLLTGKSQKLDALLELKAGKPADGDGIPDSDTISFVKQVGPLLQAKCGNCHVTGMRGRFSMSSFTVLMRGPTAGKVIFENKPDDSRLIEVIENGDMPRGGGSVSKEELATLKSWIAQGAKFDGPDPDANLAQLSGGNPNPRGNSPRLQPKMAERSEVKISFAIELAPIIVEHCSGCHLNTQRVRGGLNMSNFRGFLRGGDNGNIIEPGKSAESMLIKKLMGTGGGNQMPPGKPLSDDIISKFKTWVDEGAPFDGRNVNNDTSRIAAIGKAESSSHEQLSKDRKELSRENWKLVMNETEFRQVESENFLIIGSQDEKTLQAFAEKAEELSIPIAKKLKFPKGKPLVKGRMTVYLFEQRYDYAEFGKMVERRELPRSFKGHWGYTTLDAYVVLQTGRNANAENVETVLAQQIAATATASLNETIPKWYANGIGYWTTSKMFPRDESVKSWRADAESVARNQNKPDDFIQGAISEDKAGLVSFYFVDYLNKNASRFGKLFADLQTGKDFDDSFAKTWGMKPSALINQLTGGQPKPSRGRNRK